VSASQLWTREGEFKALTEQKSGFLVWGLHFFEGPIRGTAHGEQGRFDGATVTRRPQDAAYGKSIASTQRLSPHASTVSLSHDRLPVTRACLWPEFAGRI